MATTFTLARRAETACSTWGEFRDAGGRVLCQVLERGPANPAHPRIAAGTYEIARKPPGASHFDHAFQSLIGADYTGVLWLPHVPGRTNIEIHTANLVQQLEGCLATGEAIERDRHGDFMIAGGTSRPAYARLYPVVSAAIDGGGARLAIADIIQGDPT